MDNQRKVDIISGFFFLLLGLILYFILIPISIEGETIKTLGANYVPNLLSFLLIIFSVIILIKSANKQFYQTEDDTVTFEDDEVTNTTSPRAWASFFVVILMIAYIYIYEYIGFLLSSIFILVPMMLILRVKKWYLYAIVIVFIFMIKYIFEEIMLVNLS